MRLAAPTPSLSVEMPATPWPSMSLDEKDAENTDMRDLTDKEMKVLNDWMKR
jgi:hypothetical protein